MCLSIELYILPFKENIICQDSNKKFKYKIEFKFNYQLLKGAYHL